MFLKHLKGLKRLPYTALTLVAVVLPLWVFEWGPSDAALPENHQITPIASANQKLGVSVQELDLLVPPPAQPIVQLVKVGKGDTMMKIFIKAGVARKNAHRAIASLSKIYNPKRIRPGQDIEFVFEPAAVLDKSDEATEKGELKQVTVQPDLYREYTVYQLDDDKFTAKFYKKAVKTKLARAEGKIKSSLYVSAVKAGLPVPVLMELIRIYSWDVDFQRSIRSGDQFEVMYERQVTETGELARYGNILFANLKLGKNNNPLYHHKDRKGFSDYFDDKGRSARKALMRTPINGARLSSGFGRRRHPVLGYNKMHRGVDFAAARGTPIFAAGSGTVVYRARNGSYGNYIRIRHNSEYSTAYAHMSKFRGSVRRGSRVRQGQIIGYVGTTGRSTGAHLHYEILRRGRQTNPMRVKMPSGKQLKGKQLAKFMKSKSNIDFKLAGVPKSEKIAQNSKPATKRPILTK
ncbi:MAG: M23 family metallopeptidase [Rhodospirillaceae bacterium]|nr:M23 family metallopeptidase [Rhodospirillaceae bacterium]MBT4589028.1 M23 family metallopeptidase [Rhodospirillaceae bacterium]MBT5941463.1 M23 family metallopeptidase [Rhodospirillaceae bacterium]